ncbi:RsfS/YbeB/iojap family protein [Kyrpidia sp.]|uniref:RsfS/YbeB/iojap family protein n=1 Tax=Kyrpidia sp. TaxID=2073077 RepID=UPI00258E4423|nr:RsfS/YbeB/iojap family protein [Kyrpidia sp.]MCL6576320.1 RsfS/YbeB/iojap family protein [Kyrpidia sp.]
MTTGAAGAAGAPGGDGLPAPREVAVAAARAAADKHATDVVVLDVSNLIVITDAFVICTAATERHRQGADLVRAVVKEAEKDGVLLR